jgi:hypothetical protein
MTTRILVILLSMALAGLSEPAKSTKNTKLSPEAEFAKTVQPLLSAYCVGCHNPKYKQANLDLAQLSTPESIGTNPKEWRKVAWRMGVGDMPPDKSPRPKASAQKATVKWIQSELARARAAEK